MPVAYAQINTVARRVYGESNGVTLAMQLHSAVALYSNDDATPDDFREAMTTLEETGRTARRVLGIRIRPQDGSRLPCETAEIARASRAPRPRDAATTA